MPLFGQDLIVLQGNEEIISQVTQIEKWHVYYRPYDQPDATPAKIAKADISYILFQDGMKQFFSSDDLPPIIVTMNGQVVPDSLYDADLYELGVTQAVEYYQRKSPFWGTFGATAFYPVVGLFTGIVTGLIVGAIPPTIDYVDTPDPVLYQSNGSYAEGYREQAHRNKVKQVIKGYAFGAALQGIIIIVFLSTI